MYSRFTEDPKRDWRFLKEVNETRILELIRTENGISRAGLAKKARMSKAAISEIIARLLSAGLIKEEGKGASTSRGGKRPTNLYIDPAGGYVFGIQIKRSSALIMLANIMGEEIETVQLEYEPNPPLKDTFALFADTMDRMIEKAELLREKLLGIGIGVPGMVDTRTGELILAETLEGWANQPFAELFSGHFDAPVVVENDINIQTWGEYLLGAGVNQDDMVLMHIGDGIGAGIIENEVLVRGIMGGSGEIGYISLAPYSAMLKDNVFYHEGHQYVGQLFSRANILGAFEKAYEEAGAKFPVTKDIRKLKPLFDRADQNDAVAKRVLDDMTSILGVICSNLIIMLNSSMLVISGSMFNRSPYFLTRLQYVIMKYIAVTPLQRSTEIVYGKLNSEAALRGAVSLALDILYKPFIRKQK